MSSPLACVAAAAAATAVAAVVAVGSTRALSGPAAAAFFETPGIVLFTAAFIISAWPQQQQQQQQEQARPMPSTRLLHWMLLLLCVHQLLPLVLPAATLSSSLVALNRLALAGLTLILVVQHRWGDVEVDAEHSSSSALRRTSRGSSNFPSPSAAVAPKSPTPPLAVKPEPEGTPAASSIPASSELHSPAAGAPSLPAPKPIALAVSAPSSPARQPRQSLLLARRQQHVGSVSSCSSHNGSSQSATPSKEQTSGGGGSGSGGVGSFSASASASCSPSPTPPLASRRLTMVPSSPQAPFSSSSSSSSASYSSSSSCSSSRALLKLKEKLRQLDAEFKTSEAENVQKTNQIAFLGHELRNALQVVPCTLTKM
jgi:hypothetical protein